MLLLLANCVLDERKEEILANNLPVQKIEIASILPEIALTTAQQKRCDFSLSTDLPFMEIFSMRSQLFL